MQRLTEKTELTHKTGNDNDNSKKKRKSKDNLAYGIAMGMLGGTALGSAFDDLAL